VIPPDPPQALARYLDQQGRTDEYFLTHRRRFEETWRLLHPLLPATVEVLELGQLSMIGAWLRDGCGLAVTTLESDLRYGFPLHGPCTDLILCLEVLEHLNDAHFPGTPIGEIATFTQSGAYNMFRECRRLLRPGGLLVVTTPNANSIDVIGNALRRRHPFQYPPHVREYAPAGVIAMAEACGFTCEAFATFFAWNSHPDIDRAGLMDQLAALGFDMSDRGDDAFFAFRAA
jgi:SAM-dependent methyltransferase